MGQVASAASKVGKLAFNAAKTFVTDLPKKALDTVKAIADPVSTIGEIVKDPMKFAKQQLENTASLLIPGGPATVSLLKEVDLPIVGKVGDIGNKIVAMVGDHMFEFAKSAAGDIVGEIAAGHVDGAADMLESLAKKTGLPIKELAAFCAEGLAADGSLVPAERQRPQCANDVFVTTWRSGNLERCWGRLLVAMRILFWAANPTVRRPTHAQISCLATCGDTENVKYNLLWSILCAPPAEARDMCAEIVSSWPKAANRGCEMFVGIWEAGRFRCGTAAVNGKDSAFRCTDVFEKCPHVYDATTKQKQTLEEFAADAINVLRSRSPDAAGQMLSIEAIERAVAALYLLTLRLGGKATASESDQPNSEYEVVVRSAPKEQMEQTSPFASDVHRANCLVTLAKMHGEDAAALAGRKRVR